MKELTFKSRCVFSLQVSAVDSLEGPLLQVEGLSDLRLELHSKKMNMHLVLIDELHRHLYIKSTNRVGQRVKEKGRIRWVWCEVNWGHYVQENRGQCSLWHKKEVSWENAINLHIKLSFLARKFLVFMAAESRKPPNMLMHLQACEQSVLVLSLLLVILLGLCCFPQNDDEVRSFYYSFPTLMHVCFYKCHDHEAQVRQRVTFLIFSSICPRFKRLPGNL